MARTIQEQVADKLLDFSTAKQSIKTAIESKGRDLAEIEFVDYADEISSIQIQKPEQEKSVTPTKATQVVTPDTGKALSKVTVNPIPANYIDPNDGTSTLLKMTPGIYFPKTGSFSKTVTISVSGKTTVNMNNTQDNYLPIPSDWTGNETVLFNITNNAASRETRVLILYDSDFDETISYPAFYTTSSNNTLNFGVASANKFSSMIILIYAMGQDPA